MDKLTIRDIARMAGVSTTAVSFVLNGRSGVSDATRQKVQEIIRQTGFTPNIHTRRLNLKRSFTVHVVMRQYDFSLFNLFAMDVLTGIFKESKLLGYSVIFTAVEKDTECSELMDAIHSKDSDGVIFIQVCNQKVIRLLQEEQFPYLCVDSHVPQDGHIPLLEVNYYDAARRAIRYLAAQGHRDIGFLISDRHQEFYRNTLAGFTDAMSEAGLPCRPEWMQRVIHNIPQPATNAMEKMLANRPWPTAVFCASDTYAANAIRYVTGRGLRVPEDISFMGRDDLVISEYTRPAITTMGLDKIQMGRQAMHTLFQMMNGEDFQRLQLLPTTLVERDSVRTLKEGSL